MFIKNQPISQFMCSKAILIQIFQNPNNFFILFQSGQTNYSFEFANWTNCNFFGILQNTVKAETQPTVQRVRQSEKQVEIRKTVSAS
jgi:hypothetical protein